MARKPGQTTRSKVKPKQQMKARLAEPVATPELDPARLDEDVPGNRVDRAETSMPASARRSAARAARPYQHRKSSPTARMPGASVYSISKAQEYAFIREDLRRLLITAGILIIVMIALLFGIDR